MTARKDWHPCGAKAHQSDEPCKLPAGFGTDHVGFGRCKFHGGSTTAHRKSAKRLQVNDAITRLGLPTEIEAEKALLEELARANGRVQYLWREIEEAPEDEDRGIQEARIHNLMSERRHLAQIAVEVEKLGLIERRVQIAEEQGALVAQVIRNILDRLFELPSIEAQRQEAAAIVRAELLALPRGDAA